MHLRNTSVACAASAFLSITDCWSSKYESPKGSMVNVPHRNAIGGQRIRFLTNSRTDDKAVDLTCSRCNIKQQEVKASKAYVSKEWLTPKQSRPGQLCEQCNEFEDAQLARKWDRAFSSKHAQTC